VEEGKGLLHNINDLTSLIVAHFCSKPCQENALENPKSMYGVTHQSQEKAVKKRGQKRL
jgi:hypothetical protein